MEVSTTSILALQERIRQLESDVSALKERLRSVSPLYGGVAEFYIAELVGGHLTTGLAAHDILSPSGHLLEVKFSALGTPSKVAPTKRWSWGHPLGESGAKVFDRLILVGEVDERYKSVYPDPACPYVLFDVPYAQVVSITRKLPIIQITSRPHTDGDNVRQRMFREYCVTSEQLRQRYGIRTNPARLPAGTLEAVARSLRYD